MAFVNLFAPTISAMRADATAFKVISDNIANSVTPGYKAADTRFGELLTQTASSTTDYYGGTYPQIQNFVDKQGTIAPTQRPFDIAINGKGFLVSNTALDGSGDYLLGRAGQLVGTTVQTGGTEATYLTDSSGAYVLGWQADANGNFTTSNSVSSLTPIRIDTASTQFDPVATTAAMYNGVLPAGDAAGSVVTGSLPVVDAQGVEHTLSLQFTKSATPNTWDMVASVSDGTVSSGSTATLSFDATGALVSPTSQSLGLTFSGSGGSTSVALDLSPTRELGAPFTTLGYSQNGITAGQLVSLAFDDKGVLSGTFSNGQTRALYKLPLAAVNSPDQLAPVDGTHFALTPKSGDITLFDASQSEVGSFVPSALEQSTTDIGTEFSKLILTQQSYASATRAFTVADDMARVAYQLKS